MKVLIFLVSNAIVVTCLLGVGLLLDRFLRWPAIRHLVWAALLVALLIPPFISISNSVPGRLNMQDSVELFAITESAQQLSITANDYGNESVVVSSTSWSFLSPAAIAMYVEVAGAVFFLGLALFRTNRLSTFLNATEPAPKELLQSVRRLAWTLGLRMLPRIRI